MQFLNALTDQDEISQEHSCDVVLQILTYCNAVNPAKAAQWVPKFDYLGYQKQVEALGLRRTYGVTASFFYKSVVSMNALTPLLFYPLK